MQTPTDKTPVSKDIDLAAYAARMLSKFPDNLVLKQLSEEMLAAGASLATAQRAYEDAVRAILPTRVDVKYENYASDLRIRRTQKKADLADGRPNGPIAKAVFPEGSAPIVRLQGASQVDAMVNLEGRLGSAKALWNEAETEKADVKSFRERYAGALEGRRAAGQTARDSRVERNAEKNRFLVKYAEIGHKVEAEFPRDRAMSDLFFDDVRGRSTAQQASEDEEVPEPEDDAVAAGTTA
jgi:hypothetical protein